MKHTIETEIQRGVREKFCLPSKSEASSLAQVLHISSPRTLPIICTLYRRIINLYIAYDNAWCVTG